MSAIDDRREAGAPPVEEADSVQIGPASHMMLLETDGQGEIAYRLGSHAPQIIPLGEGFGSRRVGLIDNLRTVLVFNPTTQRLLALTACPSGRMRGFYFGALWGQWVDEAGKRRANEDPVEMMKDLRISVGFDRVAGELIADFFVNIYNRDAFTVETRRLFKEGAYRNMLSLVFAIPSGDFVRAEVAQQDMHSGMRQGASILKTFPLVWQAPSLREFEDRRSTYTPPPPPRAAPAAENRPAAEPPPPPPSGEPQRAKLRPAGGPKPEAEKPPAAAAQDRTGEYGEAPRAKLGSRPSARPEPKEGEPPKAKLGGRPPRPTETPPPTDTPLPRTELLPIGELIQLLSRERDAERQWKAIEINLMLARPERTYALIANHADTIMERTSGWPPARLRMVFRDQPGGVLVGIMGSWFVNQVLAVCEENPESDKILQWLREREVERLLRMTTHQSPANIDVARRDLRIDRHADPVMIKKVWRTLLGFMNADLGRQEERAIHRKKDEIAKYLQSARDMILKSSKPRS